MPVVNARDRWSSLALSTLASHRRQIGDVSGAAALDARALQSATDEESRADAMIGLAADDVASGDARHAHARHREAEQEAARAWRTLTRWHWVGAELALLAGDGRGAIAHARASLAACTGLSARHEAKSRVVLAATTGDVSDLPEVGRILRTERWLTLEWPIALVAADHASAVDEEWVAGAWQTGRGATYEIEVHLPEGLQETWRSHPGVRRLRADGPLAGGG